jgi:uncharacterized protein YhhL (DUF1145 family)
MFSRYFEFPFALCIFIDPMIAVCIFCFAMQLLLHGPYSLPADLQPPNATQDYQQNTQPMIETPTGTNTTKVPFLGDGRATTAAFVVKFYIIIVHCFSRNVEIFVHIFQDFLF